MKRSTAPQRDGGQGVVEYGLILASIAILCLIATLFLAGKVDNLFSQTGGDPLFAQVDRAVSRLELANVAFNAPAELGQDESAVIQLLMSLRKPVEDLQADLTEIGEKEGARIRVAPLMEARLTGSGFKIEALTPERQPVGRRTTTEWKWEIEGARPGHQQLHLTLSALITVEGDRTPRAVRTFDRTINVRVTFRERVEAFFAENWKWLWSTLLVPLAVVGWRLFRRRKEKQGGERSPGEAMGPDGR